MNSKPLKIAIIGITSLIMLSGVSTLFVEDAEATEIDDEISEGWALIIAPDYCDIHSEEYGMFYEEVLLSSGYNWKEENIIALYGETPTRSSVIQAIETIAENDGPYDTTLIIIQSHGGYWDNTGEGDFSVKDYAFPYSELDTELDKLSSEAIGIIISACHSGSAIPALQDDGRVIVTSCGAEETGGLTSEFALGLQGFADYCIDGGDKNDIVSMEEAFEYIMYEKHWTTQPQIQDDYSGELNINFLKPENKIDQVPEHTYLSDISGIVKTQYVHGVMWEDEVAQSFNPSVDTLTKVGIRIKNYDSQSPIIVSVRKELDGFDLTSKILSPAEIEIQTNSIINKKYTIFDFPDINVNPEETYYIVCKIAEPEPNIHTLFTVEGRNDNCYNRGMSYVRSASQQGTPNPSWTPIEDADFLFFTNKYSCDNIPPITTYKINGENGDNHWFISTVKIALTAEDDIQGVVESYYAIDCGPWQLYEAPFMIEIDGTHIISYYSVDKAGNQEQIKQVTVKIDTSAPMTKAILPPSPTPYYPGYVTVAFKANDEPSGVKSTFYRVDEMDNTRVDNADKTWRIYNEPFIVSGSGVHVVELFSVDNAGNKEKVKTETFMILKSDFYTYYREI